MKKLLFGAAALLVMVMASCNGASEKAREDSIRIADSIAQIEAAKAAAEQARLDSIRQDSIQNAEEFSRVVKALENLPNEKDKIVGYLTALGFKGSKKTSTRTQDYIGSEIEVEVEKYHYTFTLGDKSITYSMDFEDTLAFGSCTQKITVEGDDDALDCLYRAARKKYDNVSKRGNTIVIEESWA